MRAVDFLTLVWPTQGHYCIASPRKLRDDPTRSYWVHTVFPTIEAAATHAVAHGTSTDIYFACLSLREPYLIDEAKLKKQQDRGDRNPTGKTYRTHKNMAWARSFFLDVDIGKGEYASQALGIKALLEFLDTTDLPKPTVVSSGRGLHLYWPMAEDVPVEEWQVQAAKLKKLCDHHEFHADRTRTADSASVLRVPGTMHLKDPAHPLHVKVLAATAPLDPNEFYTRLDRAMQLTPTGEAIETPMPESMIVNQPVKLGQLAHACAQVDHLIRNSGDANEPQWYKLLGVVRFVENGRVVSHVISKSHPHYEPAWIDQKLDQLERMTADGKQLGPTTCQSMMDICGTQRCHACWYFKTPGFLSSSSPLVAARRMPRKALEGLPEPPAPYSRVKDGILRGGEDPFIICPYDLYPVRSFEDKANEKRSSQWELVLPRNGTKRFHVTHEELQDSKLLGNILGNAGFVAHFDELKWVKHYMSAYIRQLQKFTDDHEQHGHLGWVADRSGFVMPDVLIERGKPRPSMITDAVVRATGTIRKEGSLAKQRELLKFYADDRYVKHQFLIAAALAAPLFYMTGHHGTVVNMSGESGSSKSTALFTAASFWGEPEDYTINGVAGSGGTVKGKNNRFAILSNLPVCVDEITNMGVEEAKDMVMSFTQKQAEPIRLQSNTMERAKQNRDGKSTLMLTTSNNSIHSLLAFRNQAGTAGSMRLFEIPVPRVDLRGEPEPIAKAKADDYMRQLRRNFGWIGPAFMEYVTANVERVDQMVWAKVRELELAADARQAERFWFGVAAATMVALEIGYQLTLLPFDPVKVQRWLVQEQLSQMRDVVNESYASPVDTLMAYLASIANGMLVVNHTTHDTVNLKKAPQGEWTGRIETDNHRATIFLSHLKAYTVRERIHLNGLLRDLEMKQIITRRRINPGAGTDYSYGQQPCLIVDLKHPEIAGHQRLEEVDNVVTLTRKVMS